VPIYQGGLLAQAFEDSQRGTYKNIVACDTMASTIIGTVNLPTHLHSIIFNVCMDIAQLVKALVTPMKVRSCVKEVQVRSPEQTSLTLGSISLG